MTFVWQTDRQAHRQKRKKNEGKLIKNGICLTDRQTARHRKKNEGKLINKWTLFVSLPWDAILMHDWFPADESL